MRQVPGNTTSRDPAMASRMRSIVFGGASGSFSPATSSVGAAMRAVSSRRLKVVRQRTVARYAASGVPAMAAIAAGAASAGASGPSMAGIISAASAAMVLPPSSGASRSRRKASAKDGSRPPKAGVVP